MLDLHFGSRGVKRALGFSYYQFTRVGVRLFNNTYIGILVCYMCDTYDGYRDLSCYVSLTIAESKF